MTQTEIEVAISNGWQFRSDCPKLTADTFVRLSDAPDFVRLTNDTYVVAYLDFPDTESIPKRFLLPPNKVAAAEQTRYVWKKLGV